MPKGGARPGAGRKKGQRTKRIQETIAKAAATGMLPHEFLCAISQGQVIEGHTPTFSERMTAAAQAAPFYAPRLTNIDSKVSGIVTVDLTDEQLVERIRRLIANLSQADKLALFEGRIGERLALHDRREPRQG